MDEPQGAGCQAKKFHALRPYALRLTALGMFYRLALWRLAGFLLAEDLNFWEIKLQWNH